MKTCKINELIEGVEYLASNESIYKIDDDGELMIKSEGGKWKSSNIPHNILRHFEFTECEFEPEIGEGFYYSDFTEESFIGRGVWNNHYTQIRIKNITGIYRSPEQVQEKARELGWMEE